MINLRILINTLLLLLSIPLLAAVEFLPKTAPYLEPNAPTFNLTLAQFIAGFTLSHPDSYFPDCKESNSTVHSKTHHYYYCIIDRSLYSSIVIDHHSNKIRSFQLTYMKKIGNSDEIDQRQLLYIADLIRWFNPDMAEDKSLSTVLGLFDAGIEQDFYQQIENNTIRYIVADHREQGITIAIEPIKQVK